MLGSVKKPALSAWMEEKKSGVHHLRLVVYPVIYRVLYIPCGGGFLPSTVLPSNIPMARALNLWFIYVQNWVV